MDYHHGANVEALRKEPMTVYGDGKQTRSFQYVSDRGDPLNVRVNKLTSTKTQLPYSYYSLPYCTLETIVDNAENLGEVLRGDRIENSPYVFKMREPQLCNIICKKVLDKKSAKDFKEKIDDEYRVNMYGNVSIGTCMGKR